MKLNRCINCMEEPEIYPCIHCGYDPANDKPSAYALSGSILNGRYLIGGVLGQGGFGITYVALDLALQVKVAVKEFYPSGMVTRTVEVGPDLVWSNSITAREFRKKGMEYFLKEARKMAKVEHIKEVISVRDIIQENNTAYIVMDFVEGESLMKYLTKNGPISWNRAKQLFFPVIEAMEQVHQSNMIHRDISPDNLMLEPSGKVRILDLGAAKDLNVNSGVSSMMVAKSGFSPLEQYGQKGHSGPWSDVYALAATMYYALTGVVPPSTIDRLDRDTIRWDLPQLKALPKGVLAALQKAMVLQYKDRTQSMEAFLKDLKCTRKRRPLVPILLGVAALAAIAVMVLATKTCMLSHDWEFASCTEPAACSRCEVLQEEALGHDWVEADCTESKTCSRCGLQEGDPLGHQLEQGDCEAGSTCTVCGEVIKGEHTWVEADCTTPQTCKTCGAEGAEALGHDWLAATETAPKTCSRCKITEGEPIKTDIEKGETSKAREKIGPATLRPYILERTIRNCTSFTLMFELTSATGWYSGNWRLCLRDTNGEWMDLQAFTVEDNSVGVKREYEIKFYNPVTFDAIAAFPAHLTGCTWSMEVGVRGVKTK